jgi:hypothetical protein
MNPTQPELFRPRETADMQRAADWLVEYLDGKPFTPAANILQAMGMAATEDNKRWLRSVRVASGDRVIGGPGFPGYMLLKQMTIEDLQHWKRSMISQAKAMITAAIRTEKLHHKLIAQS